MKEYILLLTILLSALCADYTHYGLMKMVVYDTNGDGIVDAASVIAPGGYVGWSEYSSNATNANVAWNSYQLSSKYADWYTNRTNMFGFQSYSTIYDFLTGASNLGGVNSSFLADGLLGINYISNSGNDISTYSESVDIYGNTRVGIYSEGNFSVTNNGGQAYLYNDSGWTIYGNGGNSSWFSDGGLSLTANGGDALFYSDSKLSINGDELHFARGDSYFSNMVNFLYTVSLNDNVIEGIDQLAGDGSSPIGINSPLDFSTGGNGMSGVDYISNDSSYLTMNGDNVRLYGDQSAIIGQDSSFVRLTNNTMYIYVDQGPFNAYVDNGYTVTNNGGSAILFSDGPWIIYGNGGNSSFYSDANLVLQANDYLTIRSSENHFSGDNFFSNDSTFYNAVNANGGLSVSSGNNIEFAVNSRSVTNWDITVAPGLGGSVPTTKAVYDFVTNTTNGLGGGGISEQTSTNIAKYEISNAYYVNGWSTNYEYELTAGDAETNTISSVPAGKYIVSYHWNGCAEGSSSSAYVYMYIMTNNVQITNAHTIGGFMSTSEPRFNSHGHSIYLEIDSTVNVQFMWKESDGSYNLRHYASSLTIQGTRN